MANRTEITEGAVAATRSTESDEGGSESTRAVAFTNAPSARLNCAMLTPANTRDAFTKPLPSAAGEGAEGDPPPGRAT